MFLAKLSIENSQYRQMFLFDKNLLPDVRLLIINELISNKFSNKLQSINHIEEFFQQIEVEKKY